MKHQGYPIVLNDGELLLDLNKAGHQKPALFTNMVKTRLLVNVVLIPFKDRLVLIDTGIGESVVDRFFKNYEISKQNMLIMELSKLGISTEDITDVVLTHLHFDHAGGSVDYKRNEIIFINANHYVHKNELEYAKSQIAVNKSYLKSTIDILLSSNKLKVLENEEEEILDDFFLILTGGHTPGLLNAYFKLNADQYIFPGDLLPTPWHIRNENPEGFDHSADELKKQKEKIIRRALDSNSTLFWQHNKDKYGFKLMLNSKNSVTYKRIDERGKYE